MFQDHVNNIHFQDVAQSQVEEVISASKRLIPRNVVSEKCPFCLTTPATNQKAFASHVGKHLQEVSLAALPNIDGPDEGGSSDDSDGGDDGHPDDTSDKEEEKDDSTDSDGRSSSEGSIRTVTSLQGTTRPKRPDPDSPSGEFDGEEVPDQSTMVSEKILVPFKNSL
jgi:cobalamin biosynthesis protein CobT